MHLQWLSNKITFQDEIYKIFKTYLQGITPHGVITRYGGIRNQRVGSGITGPGSGITRHGIGISSFLRDQRSDCTIFVGSVTKIGDAFGIKDQNLG